MSVLCGSRSHPVVIKRPREAASSTTNAPKSVLSPSLMCEDSVRVSRFLPYLLKHDPLDNPSHVFNMQLLFDMPATGFSQSRTRMSPASREPTLITSLSLPRLFYAYLSLCRGRCWDDEATTGKSQCFNWRGWYLHHWYANLGWAGVKISKLV